MVHGTNQEALAETAMQVQCVSSMPTIQIFGNLFDSGETESILTQAESLAGPIDILVNNAGIHRDNLLMRMKYEEWNAVLRVNLEGPFLLCRAAIKSMLRQRYGRIINITSAVATMGNAGQTNYCASKAGLIGFTKALAREVATRNVTANCVAPGLIDSQMTRSLSDAQGQTIINSIPMRRMGVADDVAAACVFLASEEAQYITGQTIHVNGGLEMV